MDDVIVDDMVDTNINDEILERSNILVLKMKKLLVKYILIEKQEKESLHIFANKIASILLITHIFIVCTSSSIYQGLNWHIIPNLPDHWAQQVSFLVGQVD